MPPESEKTILTEAVLQSAAATTILRETEFFPAVEIGDAISQVLALPLQGKPGETLVPFADFTDVAGQAPNCPSPLEDKERVVRIWTTSALTVLRALFPTSITCPKGTFTHGIAPSTPPEAHPFRRPPEEVLLTAMLQTYNKGDLAQIGAEAFVEQFKLPDQVTILGEALDLRDAQSAVRSKMLAVFDDRRTAFLATHAQRQTDSQNADLYNPGSSLQPLVDALNEIHRKRSERPEYNPEQRYQLTEAGQKQYRGIEAQATFTVCRGPQDYDRYADFNDQPPYLFDHPELVVIKVPRVQEGVPAAKPGEYPFKYFKVDRQFIGPVMLGIPKHNPKQPIKIESQENPRPIMTEMMILRAMALARLRHALATQNPENTPKLDWNDLYVWLFTYLGLPRHALIEHARTGQFIFKHVPDPKTIPSNPWQTTLISSDFNAAFWKDVNLMVGDLNRFIQKCLDRFSQLSGLSIIRVDGYRGGKGYFLPKDFAPLLEDPDFPVFAVMVAIHEALRVVRKKSPERSELTAEACVFDGVETVILFGQKFSIPDLLAKIDEVRNRIPSALLDSPPIPESEEPKPQPPSSGNGGRRQAAHESTFVIDPAREITSSTSRLQLPSFVEALSSRRDTGATLRNTWDK